MNQERLGFKAGDFRPRVYPAKLPRGRPNPSRWKDKLKFGVHRGTYCFPIDTDKHDRRLWDRRVTNMLIVKYKLHECHYISLVTVIISVKFQLCLIPGLHELARRAGLTSASR